MCALSKITKNAIDSRICDRSNITLDPLELNLNNPEMSVPISVSWPLFIYYMYVCTHLGKIPLCFNFLSYKEGLFIKDTR